MSKLPPVQGRLETQPIRSHLAETFLTSSRLPQSTASVEAGDEADEHTEFSLLASKPKETFQKIYTLSVHDNAISQDVLLNQSMFPTGIITPGRLMRITSLLPSAAIQLSITVQDVNPTAQNAKFDASNAHLFFADFAGPDFLSRLPNVQISIPQSIATMLQLSKSNPVLVSTVDELDVRASHVELVFRDQYLARADMWRLVNDQLVGRCIHRGQKVEFMGTIKAVVKKIFVDGNKTNAALFHHSTKPVFRSESARYVLFIQMSKEMWEFDAEGSGEIMFDKVVNGFLPGLFHRWKKMQVRHLVSIVLFTRMEYNDKPAIRWSSPGSQQLHNMTNDASSKDFYRVVVSDMASIESANILDRLKKEFLVFLRDVSIRRPMAGDYAPLGSGLSAASAQLPDQVIAGQPSAASRGNVLEAINLASSQFSSDYIDRDLVRTGVSIVLISPGTGVFEVEYTLLVATTENLTDNGVGIDLVCLSRMPLHSVPLFKYVQPPEQTTNPGNINSSELDNTPTRSYSNTMNFGSPSPAASFSFGTPQKSHIRPSQWHYGIPHWIDVSYWTSGGKGSNVSALSKKKVEQHNTSLIPPKHKPFKSRVRMYELQMMGVMESSLNDISIPLLSQPSQPDNNTSDKQSLHRSLWLKAPLTPGSPIGSMSSRDGGSGIQTPKLSSSPLSAAAPNSKDIHESFGWMDIYDDKVFRHPIRTKRPRQGHTREKALKRGAKAHAASVMSNKPTMFTKTGSPNKTTHVSSLNVTDSSLGSTLSRSEADSSSVRKNRKPNRKLDSTPRKISFGPRGLGVATPTAAVAIATTDVAIGRDIKGLKRRKVSLASDAMYMAQAANSDAKCPSSDTESTQEKTGRTSESSQEESAASEDSEHEASRPIPISKISSTRTTKSQADKEVESYRPQEPHDRVAALTDLRHQRELGSNNGGRPRYGPTLPTLSPSTGIAPWLTILNPCNPSKSHMAPSNRLGRWQHIYPRPLKASQIKWKSLRCPAAIPLTTEDFPTADQLAEEYREDSYFMTLPEEMDISDQPRSLANELLAFRLSRGFQIVIGDQVADATFTPLLRRFDVFDDKILTSFGSKVYLTRGGTIHCLTRVASDRLEIKTYHRHTTARLIGLDDDAYVRYTPLIRSMLAETYENQAISTAPQRGIFNWESIDAFIAGYERPQAERYVSSLRPWRARFVLIPVDAPTSSRRTSKSRELTEEENRLEGIKKLTQFWQKCRFVMPEERPFTKNARFSEDANPLDVQYFTKNSSAVVLEELDNATGGDAISSPLQLLPEAELYQRPGLNLKVLAERLQSNKGIRIVDRRWHLKLHRHCLVGLELTTWLLENFRDVNTRQDAVELGSELMRDGLFKHVERRHEFRDGHYFYQITDEYRTPRPESKGFFGWVKASVPPTPIKESHTAGTAIVEKPHDVTDTTTTPESERPNLDESKHRSGIALGKSLIYNLVQSRPKASYREELMNLHYDRLHNPDNCYHIRIEWMNATPKLIQDAVNHWAVIVEAFGLRLVEVPIGEGSSITSMHPFRAPHFVKLAQEPPAKQPATSMDARSSVVATQAVEKHFYQKAILAHFNFVLDFEAASDYPPDVDVTYSWGKPDYRYPQYIHRSGLLIAQIRDDGHFLLLANRLYNNRSSTTRRKPLEDDTDLRAERSPVSQRANPLRAGDGLTQRSSPWSSPSPSPIVRAALDVPKAQTSTNRKPCSNSSSLHATPNNSISSDSTITDPESLTREFQAFCSNKEALNAFYADQISHESTPNPSTPIANIGKTPSRGSHEPKDEGTIPELTLPGSLTDKTDFGGRESVTIQVRESEGIDRSPSAGSVDSGSSAREESPFGRFGR